LAYSHSTLHRTNMLSSFLVAALFAAASPSLAAVNPTSPDSSTVVKVGDDITALWTVDTTGTWNNMEIQLMTGGNLQMVELAVLGQNIDGTTLTSYSVPAPDVSPYSQIYFLQFTPGGDVTQALWSTRFTIAGADGSTTPPTNTTNWNGQDVNWGTGALVGDVALPSSSNSSDSSATSNSAAPSVSAPSSTGGLNALASPSGSTTPTSSKSGAPAMASASKSAQTSGAASKNMAVGGGAMMLALAGWLL